jgi:FHS family Na+ dependent glucose MFS transporter 1
MSGAVFGPSIVKLVEQTDSSLGEISLIFPTRAFSYLVGSWIAGFLYDKYRGHKILVRILPFMAITLGLIPFLKNPLAVIFVSMLLAMATALVDVGCNILLIRVPDINIAPAMSGLHFFFGLGAFLAPMILAGSLQFTNGIAWGYWGLGLLSILLLVQFIGLKELEINSPSSENDKRTGKLNPQNQKLILWVIALFFFAFVGVEIGYGDWLSAYSITSGLATEKTAILLTSTYWGAFTFSRLISIPLAMKVKVKSILFIDVAGAIVGLGLVFLFPLQIQMLWIGTIILGLSVASLFPTMLTFAEGLMSMTGKVTSIFFVSGSVGSIFLPWLIGRSVETQGPDFIIQALFFTLLLAGMVFIVLMRLSKKPAAKAAGLDS